MKETGREKGEKRGLFRRSRPIPLSDLLGDKPASERPDAAAGASEQGSQGRRPKRSADLFRKADVDSFGDAWSTNAWAEDDWDDDWSDPARPRASVRPAADPRPEEVDAWLESGSDDFADVTRDIAERWAGRNTSLSSPNPGSTWDDQPTPPPATPVSAPKRAGVSLTDLRGAAGPVVPSNAFVEEAVLPAAPVDDVDYGLVFDPAVDLDVPVEPPTAMVPTTTNSEAAHSHDALQLPWGGDSQPTSTQQPSVESVVSDPSVPAVAHLAALDPVVEEPHQLVTEHVVTEPHTTAQHVSEVRQHQTVFEDDDGSVIDFASDGDLDIADLDIAGSIDDPQIPSNGTEPDEFDDLLAFDHLEPSVAEVGELHHPQAASVSELSGPEHHVATTTAEPVQHEPVDDSVPTTTRIANTSSADLHQVVLEDEDGSILDLASDGDLDGIDDLTDLDEFDGFDGLDESKNVHASNVRTLAPLQDHAETPAAPAIDDVPSEQVIDALPDHPAALPADVLDAAPLVAATTETDHSIGDNALVEVPSEVVVTPSRLAELAPRPAVETTTLGGLRTPRPDGTDRRSSSVRRDEDRVPAPSAALCTTAGSGIIAVASLRMLLALANGVVAPSPTGTAKLDVVNRIGGAFTRLGLFHGLALIVGVLLIALPPMLGDGDSDRHDSRAATLLGVAGGAAIAGILGGLLGVRAQLHGIHASATDWTRIVGDTIAVSGASLVALWAAMKAIVTRSEDTPT